mmetsp:Transcript_779/g.1779  ORF Transcript_779/g.1779 Transcript_779/m.1779 type:complete len:207 (-) Transcript_779:2170-2790(-)
MKRAFFVTPCRVPSVGVAGMLPGTAGFFRLGVAIIPVGVAMPPLAISSSMLLCVGLIPVCISLAEPTAFPKLEGGPFFPRPPLLPWSSETTKGDCEETPSDEAPRPPAPFTLVPLLDLGDSILPLLDIISSPHSSPSAPIVPPLLPLCLISPFNEDGAKPVLDMLASATKFPKLAGGPFLPPSTAGAEKAGRGSPGFTPSSSLSSQ